MASIAASLETSHSPATGELTVASIAGVAYTKPMKKIAIRNVPDEDYRALRVRAAQNGRSMEAELRALIERVRTANPPPAPQPRLRGAALAEAIARVRADFATLGPMPTGWSAVDELIAERRAEAAREAAES